MSTALLSILVTIGYVWLLGTFNVACAAGNESSIVFMSYVLITFLESAIFP